MGNAWVRWFLAFMISTIALCTALIGGLGQLILDSDQTHISWLILAIFFGASMHWGYKIKHNGAKADESTVTYFQGKCSSLGLLGTIIGLIIMITGAFSNLDTTNQDSIKEALIALSSGIGTALVTTMMGVICSILLQLQSAIVKLKWRA